MYLRTNLLPFISPYRKQNANAEPGKFSESPGQDSVMETKPSVPFSWDPGPDPHVEPRVIPPTATKPQFPIIDKISMCKYSWTKASSSMVRGAFIILVVYRLPRHHSFKFHTYLRFSIWGY